LLFYCHSVELIQAIIFDVTRSPSILNFVIWHCHGHGKDVSYQHIKFGKDISYTGEVISTLNFFSRPY